MADPASLQLRLERYMQENSLKQTQQRRVILEVFLDAHDHVAVDELLERVQRQLPGVGYATVYRALRLFIEAGVASERRFGDGQTRYEPAQVGAHHDHLICVDCGHIFEFEDEQIEERQTRVATEHEMTVVTHRHEIYGRCTRAAPCPFREGSTDQVRARPAS